jgi:membrane protein YqaA with SNARE-associated domain
MFEFSPESGLWGLFASAFVSATLLPGSSEVVLIGLLAKYPELIYTAVAVATIGNTCGGITSYWLGRLVPNKAEGKAIEWLKKYGMWSLLFSWVPLFGDALCVAAGWMRFNFPICMALFAVGKLFRYVLVAGGAAWFFESILPWARTTFGF